MPTTLEALLLLAVVVVPGYLLFSTLERFNGALIATQEPFRTVIQSFVGSIVIWAISSLISICIRSLFATSLPDDSLLFRLLGESEPSITHSTLAEYLVVGVIFPVLLGTLIAYVTQARWITRLLEKFALDTFSLTPTAWDSQVFMQKHGVRVVVCLEDDALIHGELGTGSAIASSKHGGDIFIQSAKCVSSSNVESLAQSTGGMWIPGGSIRYLQFVDDFGERIIDNTEIRGVE